MINLKTNNWEIKNIEAVLFDKDGTIIDSHLYWGRIITLRSKEIIKKYKLQKKLYSTICGFMGYSIKTKKLLPNGPVGIASREDVIKILHEKLRQIKINISPEELSNIFIGVHADFVSEIKNYIKILPGIKIFLKKLKSKKIKTAIVTTDTVKNTKETIKILKIENFFDLVIGKEDTVEGKLSGKPAEKAVFLLKLDKNKTICIGDAPMDIIMSQKAGLKAGIGISLGQTSSAELNKYSRYVVNKYNKIEII